MKETYKSYQIFQSLCLNDLDQINPPASAVTPYKDIVAHLVEAIFHYIRSGHPTAVFSDFYVAKIREKGWKKPQELSYFGDLMTHLSATKTSEMSYLAPLLEMNPSYGLLELIWNLRSYFLTHATSKTNYFISLEGYFLAENNIDRLLKVIEDYQHLNREELIIKAKQAVKEMNGSQVVNINLIIDEIVKEYNRNYIYSISKPKRFIPPQRNTNAYVYVSFPENPDEYSLQNRMIKQARAKQAVSKSRTKNNAAVKRALSVSFKKSKRFD